MGFLRPHRQGGQKEANNLVNQQIQQNKIELEQRRASLYNQRLGIIKSQGMQSWGRDAQQIVSGLPPQSQKQAAKAGFASIFPQ